MTDLHKAAQQALEVLERAGEELRWQAIGQVQRDLRVALAQQAEPEGSVCARCGALAFDPLVKQQAEPVAWRCACGANLYIDAQGRPASKAEQSAQSQQAPLMQEIARLHDRVKDLTLDVEFLSQPSQRKPLTDEAEPEGRCEDCGMKYCECGERK
jgi:hypothetical protein